MRTGWVLWQSNLRDFLYFEEETLAPNPEDYTAAWHVIEARGGRKPSKNLWIYEKDTGQKKFSVTTVAGAKIQPYFVVPPSTDPNVYKFRVQGEEYKPGLVRVWIPTSIARELERMAGDLGVERLQAFIVESLSESSSAAPMKPVVKTPEARAIELPMDTYILLQTHFPSAVGDAHMIQLLVEGQVAV